MREVFLVIRENGDYEGTYRNVEAVKSTQAAAEKLAAELYAQQERIKPLIQPFREWYQEWRKTWPHDWETNEDFDAWEAKEEKARQEYLDSVAAHEDHDEIINYVKMLRIDFIVEPHDVTD